MLLLPLAAYVSVNKYYREQPKCAWMCSDSVWQRLRQSVDSQGRPLLDLQDDKKLLSKPIHINNDLPSLGSTNSVLYFVDWNAMRIRVSRPIIRRATQLASFGDISRLRRPTRL